MLDNITARDIAEVRKALVKCKELEEKLDRGEACGLDCQEIRDHCNWAKKRLTDFNNLYGPQFPAKSI